MSYHHVDHFELVMNGNQLLVPPTWKAQSVEPMENLDASLSCSNPEKDN